MSEKEIDTDNGLRQCIGEQPDGQKSYVNWPDFSANAGRERQNISKYNKFLYS